MQQLIKDGELIEAGVYLMYKVKYQGMPAVIKLWYEWSPPNNEPEIISILHRLNPSLYPPLYFVDRSPPWCHTIGDRICKVYQTLCYGYISGTRVAHLSLWDKEMLILQLKTIHGLGLVHGDVRIDNIIRRDDNGQVFIVGYGCMFSERDPIMFPHMKGMMLTYRNDIDALHAIKIHIN